MPDKQDITKRLDREHPVLSEASPLNRHILRAAGLPDMKSLLMALAHPMSDEDIRMLGHKSGNHKAHHNRIKHLREHAVKKHGHVGETTADEEEEYSGRYPDKRPKTREAHGEDAGLGEFEYLHKALKVKPYVPLRKASPFGREISPEESGGVQLAPKPPEGEEAPSRSMPGAIAPSRHSVSYDPSAGRTRLAGQRINGAGYLESGPPHEPFRAKINFNVSDPHEAAVHGALKQLGHSNPENVGNEILYHDFMPDPHDPTKGVGDTAAPGSERSIMASNISKIHGGITSEQAHKVLDKFHQQALEQFNAHPMHHMNDVMIPDAPIKHPIGKMGKLFRTERTLKPAVEQDAAGNPIHKTIATRPLGLKHVARQIRWWQSIPKDQRDATRKWYNTDAHEYIKDMARAAKVPYLKAAGALALYNNGMGWETGASGAAQSLFNDTLGVKYQADDKDGKYKKGDPMTILKQTYPDVQEKIKDIAGAPDNDNEEIMKRIRKHLKTNKLGNFFMDMINAAPYHTNTNDRHELALAGMTNPPNTFDKGKDVSGEPKQGASDYEHRYLWRAKHAVAHQLDVDPREVQAANWVHWRRQKQSGTDKGENFPGWKVVRKFIDDKVLENTPAAQRPQALKRIQDRKDREVELSHIMPGMPTVQEGMSPELTKEVQKERARLKTELAGKKKAGATSLESLRERWAQANPKYAKRREEAKATEAAKKKQQKEATKKSWGEAWEDWEMDFFNEELRKAYEQEQWIHPTTYLVLRH